MSEIVVSKISPLNPSSGIEVVGFGLGVFQKEDNSTSCWEKTAAFEIETSMKIAVAVGSRVLLIEENTPVTMPSTPSVGTDYTVWMHPDGQLEATDDHETAPEEGSRKVGGFHYGHVRAVDSLWTPVDGNGLAFGSGGGTIWEQNVTVGIVPNSMWDGLWKPKCDARGMAYIGNGVWTDIYQSSVAETVTWEGGSDGNYHVKGGLLRSVYGENPATSTEGLNWFSCAELAARSGKRLMTYDEWITGAYGNPQGESAADNYGWTKATNSGRVRTGVRVNNSTGNYDGSSGIKPYAISARNIVDCVGNVYEWLSTSSTFATESAAWRNVQGTNKGQMYASADTQLVYGLAGGFWSHGVYAGARSVILSARPGSVDTNAGTRLACDSL